METIKDLGVYTFQALLNNSVKKFGDRYAVSFVNGKPLTYKELEQLSQKFAKVIQKMGLQTGDKVGIFSTNSPNWGACYFGTVNYGKIAVPMLPDFNALEVEAILKHAEVSVLFINKKLYQRIENIPETVIPTIIDIEDFTFLRYKDSSVSKADSLIDEVELPNITIKEEDTASIIYTSGTTGRSKGVELTNKNLVQNAVEAQFFHRVNKMDKCLSFLPMSHCYEFTIGFSFILLNGAAIYYLGKPPTVSALLPAFKSVRPTIVLSVPMVIEKIFKHKVLPIFSKTDFIKKLYSIRFFQKILHRIAGKKLLKTFGGKLVFFALGGAKVDPVVESFLKDAKFPYAVGYGLTETSPLLAGAGVKITKPGTIGPKVQSVELAIHNPDPKTGIGEVVAKGPNIMKGYYKDPELTAKSFTTKEDDVGEGWYKTGDLGIIEKGILSLKGRLKNMILGPSGENIYPEDIEFILNQHPLVLESLVVEDENGLLAIVQLDEDKVNEEQKNRGLMSNVKDFTENWSYMNESILSEIQFFVNKQVNRFSQVGKVTKIKEFEKTASQKIKRFKYPESLKNEK